MTVLHAYLETLRVESQLLQYSALDSNPFCYEISFVLFGETSRARGLPMLGSF